MPTTTVSVTTDDHPAQQAFVDDKNTETGYVGGVGSGKTAGGVFRTGRHISDWNEGYTGVIVSPTVPMLRNAIVDELRQWGLLDKPGIEHRRSENRIEYPNGSTIILESANNDRKIERLRGLNLAWAWMDEAAYLPEKVYRILSDRLRVGEYRNLFATTTPRGFNWLYDVFGDLDGESEPIADGRLVRNDTTTSIVGVSTRANPGNPDDYIEREERQHSGESYAQEIEGSFVQFEGLIYPWFGEDNLVESPPENYDEVIYGVDWGHNNPSTILALVRTGETWTVVDEWYETRRTVNDHSRQMEAMQEQWGRGVAYCDPSEPANIDQFQRDGINAKPAENEVTPGIQHVSSLHREEDDDLLRVVETCQELRNEFSQYQYKDDKDKPEKVNDHLCFVSGTQILTEDGERPIESIEVDDRVLTRDGYKQVAAAGLTDESATVLTIYLSNGRSLTGTPNHPIHTPSDGFVPIDSLRYGDFITTQTDRSVWPISQQSKQLSIKGSPSAATRSRTERPTGITTAHRATSLSRASKLSTAKCGRTTTGRSPTATSSTTKTGIQTTTTNQIWNVSRYKSTLSDTPTGEEMNSQRKPEKRQKNGTNLTKAGNGIASIGMNRSPKPSPKPKKDATSAGNPSQTIAHKIAGDSVQTPASQRPGANPASMTKNESAKRAESRSQSTSTATHDPVHVVAVERSCRGRSVYNLTVEGQSEYYANGVLTHNCDSLRYALFTHMNSSGLSRRTPGSAGKSQ